MRVEHGPYKSWSTCSHCGYQGLFVLHCRVDEDYDDPNLLAAVMDTRCPACESIEAVMISAEELRELQRVASAREE